MRFYPIVFFLGILSMLISITASSWKEVQAIEIAVIVHKDNVLDKADAVQVRNYYLSMPDKQWPSTTLPIQAAQRADNCLEKEKFCAKVLHMNSDDVSKYLGHHAYGQPVQYFTNDAQVAAFVASVPGAIGYVNANSLTPQVRAKVKVLTVISE